MSRELFGTDGVRGLFGQYPIDRDGAERIGRAVGTQFANAGQRIVVGRDPRQSSEELSEALCKGLAAVGVNVVLAGVLPTPGLAYLTKKGGGFAAGVMITASHNPCEYNGFKVFDGDGDKLPDGSEAELNGLIEQNVPDRGPAGQVTNDDELTKRYEDFLVGSAGDLTLNNLSLAIDSANGAASGLAERVFKRLGAKVQALFDAPDGRNINDGCGATDTAALRQAVIDDELDLGIALDGDADRVMLVDDQGREVNGDHLLYLLTVSGQMDGVVATVMSNLGLEQALERQGIKLERVQVGDRYVLEGLKRTGYHLGGEQSGHIVFPELLKTGDGLLTAVQAVKALASSDKTLAQWRDEVKLLPQALVNFTLADKAALKRPEVEAFIKRETEKLSGQGRLLIRPSGTEPLARVMVEAPDAQTIANRIAEELKGLVA
ncbi:MAG TPA: phosphoglucosamine mutase [Candidatus Dormibacteraeota bacterium]|nr:phosphoglucosamine mutase [Candidatus Dormibacteraeota bacterium]